MRAAAVPRATVVVASGPPSGTASTRIDPLAVYCWTSAMEVDV